MGKDLLNIKIYGSGKMCSKIEKTKKVLRIRLYLWKNRGFDEDHKNTEKYKWRRKKEKRLVNQLIYFSNGN